MVGSSSAIISIARTLGAPVMLPPGKTAAMTSLKLVFVLRVPRMELTRCRRNGNVSTSQSRSTLSESTSQILDRSLRRRSTIMIFSERSFSDCMSSSESS